MYRRGVDIKGLHGGGGGIEREKKEKRRESVHLRKSEDSRINVHVWGFVVCVILYTKRRWVRHAPGVSQVPALAATVRDWLELARIGQYYATQDMVGPSFGADTLSEYYAELVAAHRAAKADQQGGPLGGGPGGGRKKSGSGLFYQGLEMPPTTVLAAKAVKVADAFAAARDALFRVFNRPPPPAAAALPAAAAESAKTSARSRERTVMNCVAEKTPPL